MNGVLKRPPPAFPIATKWESAVLDEAKLFEQIIYSESFGTFGTRFFEFGTAQFLQPSLFRILVTF